jgi:GTPase
LHLVDGNEEDVAEAYKVVRRELKAYSAELAGRKEIVALSKCDSLDAAAIEAKCEALKKAARKKPLVLSAVANIGVKETLFAITKEITAANNREHDPADDVPWTP